MAEIIPFVRKRCPDDYPTFTKVVDGEILECVDVDSLTPRQRAKYFDTASAGQCLADA